MAKGVFFDRDGVINKLIKKNNLLRPPWYDNEILYCKDFLRLNRNLKKNYLVFVVSNQPDAARGLIEKHELKNINQKIIEKIQPTDFLVDYTDDKKYKKPSPYMILNLAKKYSINLNQSWVVGDRWSDIVSGDKAGCRTILLEKDYSHKKNSSGDIIEITPDFVIKKISEVERILL